MAKNNGGNRKGFFGILVGIAVIGAIAILYFAKNPGATESTAPAPDEFNITSKRYASTGPAQPYVLGDTTAPVMIEEFADYECPQCGRYATITEPDTRKGLVDSKQAFVKYYDFPLPMHKNTQLASNAAACAADQGKFWEMHDAIFAGQADWGLAPDGSELLENAGPVFAKYAATVGLNTAQWQKCFDSRSKQSRIDANTAEGLRRGVNSTPTFYVGGKKLEVNSTFDNLKAAVAAAAAAKGK